MNSRSSETYQTLVDGQTDRGSGRPSEMRADLRDGGEGIPGSTAPDFTHKLGHGLWNLSRLESCLQLEPSFCHAPTERRWANGFNLPERHL